jgi:hypothetical protein
MKTVKTLKQKTGTRKLPPPIFILSLLLLSSCKSSYIPDNEIIIKTLSYKENEILPSPETGCFLRIELLKPDTYDRTKLVFHDTLQTGELRLTPGNMLHFGHQGIYASKNGKSALYEIVYKGGSIQLSLIIK